MSSLPKSQIEKFHDKKGNSYPYLFVDKITGIFYARKGDITSSLQTTEFNKARSMVIERISELTKLSEQVPKKNLILKDYYQLMIKQKIAEEVKVSTMKKIEGIWRLSLEPYWAFLTPDDISQEVVTDFITWHKRKRPGLQLINVFKYLGNIFSIMVERGDLPPMKKPKLEVPREEQKQHDRQKGRYITDEEIQEVIKHCDTRTKLIVEIAFCTGMRKMEIGALELFRLEKREGRFVIVLETDDTKTGLAREIPLPASLTAQTEAAIDKRSPYLFPMKTDPKRNISSQLIDKGWIEAKEEAGIKSRMRFHDIRHTAATNLAKDGINPVVAVTMLGMSFVTFQKRYLKLTAKDLIIASETNSHRLEKKP